MIKFSMTFCYFVIFLLCSAPKARHIANVKGFQEHWTRSPLHCATVMAVIRCPRHPNALTSLEIQFHPRWYFAPSIRPLLDTGVHSQSPLSIAIEWSLRLNVDTYQLSFVLRCIFKTSWLDLAILRLSIRLSVSSIRHLQRVLTPICVELFRSLNDGCQRRLCKCEEAVPFTKRIIDIRFFSAKAKP